MWVPTDCSRVQRERGRCDLHHGQHEQQRDDQEPPLVVVKHVAQSLELAVDKRVARLGEVQHLLAKRERFGISPHRARELRRCRCRSLVRGGGGFKRSGGLLVLGRGYPRNGERRSSGSQTDSDSNHVTSRSFG